MTNPYDVVIIGGGIIGPAVAWVLSSRWDLRILLLEAESELATHQTGHNSGVIHSGLYYRPGSLKARNCTSGREKLYEFCQEHNIPHDRCGKIVVACTPEEVTQLNRLEDRGRENGIADLRRLEGEEIAEYEPHVSALAALHVPVTGIVDYPAVAKKYAELAKQNGADIQTNQKVEKVTPKPGQFIIQTAHGEVIGKHLINCAGLECDRVAKLCGIKTPIQIIPFRGDYYELVPDRTHLIKNLVYPVPDPRFPFLGVHFTRMIHGGVEAGPNAVLSLKREGYHRTSFSLKDTLETMKFPGFWKLGKKHWRMGLAEVMRAASKSAFVRDLRKLVPEIKEEDVRPAGAGVRAQAVEPDGSLVDDFYIESAPGQLHVLNAPSPAATASISIGETIAEQAATHFELGPAK
ncbi:FAD dependent oxidoreductase [Planctomycetales bacterium 10988]|nr:FAD dependent oxidoreductase [Planctomycetales bacterium 10988]